MALMTPLGEIRVFLDGEPYPYVLKKKEIGYGYNDLQGRYTITMEVIPHGKRHTVACCLYPNQIVSYSCSHGGPNDGRMGSDYYSADKKIKVTILTDLSEDADGFVNYSGSHYEKNGIFYDTYETAFDAHFYEFGIAWLTDCNKANERETFLGASLTNCNYAFGNAFDGPAITGMGYSPDEIRMIDVKDPDSRIRNSSEGGNVIYRFTRTDEGPDRMKAEAFTVRWNDKTKIRELLDIPDGIDPHIGLDIEGYPFRRFMVLYNPLLSTPQPAVLVAKYVVYGNDWEIADLGKDLQDKGVAGNATIRYFQPYSRQVTLAAKQNPDTDEIKLLQEVARACREGFVFKQNLETAENIEKILKDKEANIQHRKFLVSVKSELTGDETEFLIRLGDACLNGTTFEQDYKAAKTLYTMARDAGNAQAYCDLAWMYQNGFGVTRDNKIAIELYKEAAERGDAEAMVSLGGIYKDGAFIELDYEESFNWYKKAADAGNAEGLFNVAKCYDSGLGTKKNRKRAFEIFKQLADDGMEDGAYFYVASYYAGGSVTEQDNDKALIYFQKGAEAGNPCCCNRLADIYSRGIGVTPDTQKAYSWFLREAELGDPIGYSNVGWMYENGDIGEPDPEMAMKYYKLAADAGVETAKDSYDCLKAELTPYETDRKSFRYYYGELTEETLAAWDKISDPFKILTKKKALERRDRHDTGWWVDKFADENFMNKREVEEYGSRAYQCTGAQLKQLQKETGWIIPGIGRVDDDKIYGLVYIGNPEPPKIELGFNEYWTKVLAEHGYTPESARDYVVEKLRKANVNEKTIERFLKPVDQLEFSQTDTILEMALWHKDEPEAFMKRIGRDLSRDSDYMTMLACWE